LSRPMRRTGRRWPRHLRTCCLSKPSKETLGIAPASQLFQVGALVLLVLRRRFWRVQVVHRRPCPAGVGFAMAATLDRRRSGGSASGGQPPQEPARAIGHLFEGAGFLEEVVAPGITRAPSLPAASGAACRFSSSTSGIIAATIRASAPVLARARTGQVGTAPRETTAATDVGRAAAASVTEPGSQDPRPRAGGSHWYCSRRRRPRLPRFSSMALAT